MKVILFIGHHKVGSSSLQQFLSQNSLALLRAGILYPSVEFQGMATMLAKALRGKDTTEVLPINLREAHNALAFKMIAEHTGGSIPPYHQGLPHTRQMFRAIEQQIEILQPKTVILTAEVFANFSPVSTDLIDRLYNFFKGNDIRIVATLRRVDDYLASWHAQRLQFNHKILPLSAGGLEPYKTGIHFDYRVMLDGWTTNMPGAKIVLRNYSDVLASGGSIEDFIASSGIKFPKKLLPAGKANTSLHRGLVEIARRGNHQLNDHDAQVLRRALKKLTPRMSLPSSRDVEMFGKEVREDLVASFTPIHEYLGAVSGKPPFFPDMEDALQTKPLAELDVATTALQQLKPLSGDIQNPAVQEFLRTLNLESPA